MRTLLLEIIQRLILGHFNLTKLMGLGVILVLFVANTEQVQAVNIEAMTKTSAYFGRDVGVLSVDKLKAAGISEVKSFANEKEMTLLFLGSKGDILKQFMWRRTAPKTLEQFRPSKFTQWYKSAAANAGPIAAAKIRQFPFEAMAFYSAIGAMNVYDLIFHYADNPAIIEQFYESQKDPMGHVSFYAFMAANGITAEPLQEVIRNRKLHHFLPYFGMSTGMMASNVVSDLWNSQSLRTCAKSWLEKSRESQEACDKAWDDMNNHWGDKWGQYATGWMSMMGSTLLSGAADWAIAAGQRRAMMFLGLEMSFNFGTAGTSVATRFLWTVIKNVEFLAIDHWLKQPIETVWLNVFGKGSELSQVSHCLGIQQQKLRLQSDPNNLRGAAIQLAWDKLCREDITQTIESFSRIATEWRSENLKPILASQANWQMYLAHFAGRYRTSQAFYLNLTDQIWRKNYGNLGGQKSPLDQHAHFFAIRPDQKDETDWTLYLADITDLEKKQKERILSYSRNFKFLIENDPTITQHVGTFEKKILSRWLEEIISSDDTRMEKALREITITLVGSDSVGPQLPYGGTPASPGLRALLQASFIDTLGRPWPTPSPGEGFLKAWMMWKGKDPGAEARGQSVAFPRNYKMMATPTAPEYLVAAMAYGPDVENGESVINRNSWGGLAEFNPPKILLQGQLKDLDVVPVASVKPGLQETIFTKRVQHERLNCTNEVTCQQPIWNLIRAGWIRPDVMNKDGNQMAKWWTEKVEKPYLDAWYDFEIEYESIVRKFAKGIFDQPDRWFNTSGFANGAMTAIEQEQSVYLRLLNDLMQLSSTPLALDENTYSILKRVQNDKSPLRPELESYLKSWESVRAMMPEVKKDINSQMDAEKGILKSRVPNDQLESATKNIDSTLDKLLEALPANLGAASASNKVLAQLLVAKLKSLNQEILDYALVINTASYVENHNADGKVRKTRCRPKTSTGADRFRGDGAAKNCEAP